MSVVDVLVLTVNIGIVIILISLYRKVVRIDRKSYSVAETRDIDLLYKQLEAYFVIDKTLEPNKALPALRGFAAAPDFLRVIMDEILARKSNLVVELGSGVSTIIIGLALKKIGKGRLISVDHEELYKNKTLDLVSHYGLEDFVDVVCAPLSHVSVGGKSYQWYDLSKMPIDNIGGIDLLIVDGPPSSIQKESRYPALPLFLEKMSSEVVVICDDYRREDEKSMVRKWMQEVEGFRKEEIDCVKGCVVLKRE